MNRPIREWFQLIPDPSVRKRALQNTHPINATIPVASLDQALHCGFTWMSTPEGSDYWVKVVNNERYREQQHLKKKQRKKKSSWS